MGQKDMERLSLTITQVAADLGVSRASVYRLLNRGLLPLITAPINSGPMPPWMIEGKTAAAVILPTEESVPNLVRYCIRNPAATQDHCRQTAEPAA